MTKNTTNRFVSLLSATRRTLLTVALLSLTGSAALAQYCNSNATSTFDTEIDLVTFNTINNNTAGICATYSNFLSISTNVTIGSTYPISVTAGTCGGNYTKSGVVYIDWNLDQDFLDPGEIVFSFGPTGGTQNFASTVTVPGTASLGSTRMRVVVVETSSPAAITPCGTYAWGETEDYTVNINPSAPNDIGVSNITSPLSGCGLGPAVPISITVSNFGTNTQTAWNVNYRVNGGPIVTEPMAVSMASGASVPYTFAATANLSLPGTYTIKAWSSLATDAFGANDSTTRVVTSIPTVTTFPYVQDFEASNGGWLPGGPGSSWAYGLPAKTNIVGAASGTKAYVTGGLGTGTYSANEDSYILSPCFDLSSLQNPWISMDIWWYSENFWDGSNLQYSTDGGITWFLVGAFGDPGNWYNMNNLIAQPGGVGDGWTGTAFGQPPTSGGYVNAAHRLDGLAGVPGVRFRITFASDGSVNYDGTAIDNIRIAEGPVANIGPDTLICGGDSLTINAGNFSSFQWSTGANTQLDTITQTNTGTIWVKITDVNGFYDYDTIVVGLSNPIVQLGIDSTVCPGDTVVLNAGNHPGGTFDWTNGDSVQIVYAVTPGQYYVTVTDSVGCTKSDSMMLANYIPPVISLGNDTVVCVGEPVLMDGGIGPVGTTYQWNSGASTQIVIVTSPGSYSASVTTPGGCTAVDTLVVTNFPSPGVSLGPDHVECGPFTLDAGPGGLVYIWNTGAGTQTINANAAGSYAVTITNSFGCQRSDTVNITMSAPPTVSLGPDQLLCNGVSITLNAGNPGMTYLWSNGQTSQSITVNNPGDYLAFVTNAQGCTGVDSIHLGSSNLLVNLGSSASICGPTGTTVLDAGNPGSVFLWSTGATTQQVTVNAVGTYSVTVTDALGCTATDNITVNQQQAVTAGFQYNPTSGTLFAPVQFTDQSNGGANGWTWYFGDGLTSTAQNPTHTYQAFGTYNVMLIVTNGTCRDTLMQTIEVNGFVNIDDQDFAQSMQIWPNPSAGLFHLAIAFAKPKGLSWEVCDLSGKVLLSEQVGAASLVERDIDLSGMAQGMYILRLKAGDRQVFHKLVVE
jgi:PKD repeat protein